MGSKPSNKMLSFELSVTLYVEAYGQPENWSTIIIHDSLPSSIHLVHFYGNTYGSGVLNLRTFTRLSHRSNFVTEKTLVKNHSFVFGKPKTVLRKKGIFFQCDPKRIYRVHFGSLLQLKVAEDFCQIWSH